MRCHVAFHIFFGWKKTSFSFFLFTKRKTWQSQEFEENRKKKWWWALILVAKCRGRTTHMQYAGPYSVCVCVCRNSHASHKEGTVDIGLPSFLVVCTFFYWVVDKFARFIWHRRLIWILTPQQRRTFLNIHAHIGEKEQQQQTEWIRDVRSVTCFFCFFVFFSCLFIETKTSTCFLPFEKIIHKNNNIARIIFLYSATTQNNNISFDFRECFFLFCFVVGLKEAVTSPGAAFSPDLFRESAKTGESFLSLCCIVSSCSPTTEKTVQDPPFLKKKKMSSNTWTRQKQGQNFKFFYGWV